MEWLAYGKCQYVQRMWILFWLLLFLLFILWDVFYIHVSIYIITIKQSKPEKKIYESVLKTENGSILSMKMEGNQSWLVWECDWVAFHVEMY
jgi:hypothetical protein